MEQSTATKRRVDLLTPWLLEHRAVIENVHIDSTGGGASYGLRSGTAPLRVFIPHQLVLTASQALKDPSVGKQLTDLMLAMLEFDLELSERQIILLFLIVGRRSPTATFWSPYLIALPDDVKCPSSWELDSPEMSLLAGTELEVAVNAKRRSLAQEFSVFVEVFSMLPDALGPETLEWFTYDTWLWADSVYWSRVFSLREALLGLGEADDVLPAVFRAPASLCDMALVPLVDFLNHSDTDPTCHWTIRLPETADGSLLVELVDDRAASADCETELSISYGDKPNAELLFHYGFCSRSIRDDSVGLPLPSISGDEVVSDKKQAVLTALGMTQPVFRLRMPAPDAPPCAASVLKVELDNDALRVLMCDSEEQLDELLATASSRADGVFRVGVVSELVEARVSAVIVQAAQNMLDSMCSPAELEACENTPRVSIVKTFVNMQRSILEACLAVLQA